ncbi:envelope glycoprotein [Paramarasmius palmivorus]|uniref:Envelope glycoprotein n=1 Tax=Paramarasmius palmivorus TaxID=297713 RepID=A0AAW0DMR8_9AGAR
MSSSDGFALYHYVPSMPAAMVAAAVFGLSIGAHGWQIRRARTWYMVPLVISLFVEQIGYVVRIFSHRNNKDVIPYVTQLIAILIAPAFIAASIYMILRRLIDMLQGEQYSLIPAKWLTKIFVSGDIFIVGLLSAGGGMMASDDLRDTGERLIKAGLIVQLTWTGLFVVTTLIFHIRITRFPTPASTRHRAPMSWRTMLYVLYAANVLITVRTIFRLVQYIQGNDGTLVRRELYLYIFDGVFIAIAVTLFNVFHPSRVLAKQMDDKEYNSSTSSDAETYQMSPGV